MKEAREKGKKNHVSEMSLGKKFTSNRAKVGMLSR